MYFIKRTLDEIYKFPAWDNWRSSHPFPRSPSGSLLSKFPPNLLLPQPTSSSREGKWRPATDTGSGQESPHPSISLLTGRREHFCPLLGLRQTSKLCPDLQSSFSPWPPPSLLLRNHGKCMYLGLPLAVLLSSLLQF